MDVDIRYPARKAAAMQVLGKSAKYALQAMRIILSRPAGELTPAALITERLEGSPTYINKILQALVHAELLESRKGARGGFSIRRPVTEVTLWDVVSPFEDLDSERCAIDGGTLCTAPERCGMHDFWAGVRSQIVDKLKRTTLHDYHRSER